MNLRVNCIMIRQVSLFLVTGQNVCRERGCTGGLWTDDFIISKILDMAMSETGSISLRHSGGGSFQIPF